MAVVFYFFVDTISITIVFSSVTEVSSILFKYLLFAQAIKYFALMISFIFKLTWFFLFYFCFELHVVLFNLRLQLHGICSVIFCAITLNALTFMSFIAFGTHIFGDETLELPLHLFKLIMNG